MERGGGPGGSRFAWEADTLPAELLPLGRLGPKPVRRESTTGARRWASRRDTSLDRTPHLVRELEHVRIPPLRGPRGTRHVGGPQARHAASAGILPRPSDAEGDAARRRCPGVGGGAPRGPTRLLPPPRLSPALRRAGTGPASRPLRHGWQKDCLLYTSPSPRD